MELFCILLFLPDRVSYFTPLTYIEYEASNIPPLRSKLERKSATFIVSITFWREPKRHYINFGKFVCWRVGLLANWIVGELVCRRVVHKPCSTTVRAYAAFSLFWLLTTTIDGVLKKIKNNFSSCTFPAFTTVASAIFGRTHFSSHAYYPGCVGQTQGTTFTSHASYFDASIGLHADDIGHFGI